MLEILKEKVKFIFVGSLNTGLTYIIYLLLLKINLHYLFSFTISWFVGFLFTFLMSAKFVFNTKLKDLANIKKKLFLFLVLSLAQLFISILMLEVIIIYFDLNVKIAPLIIVAILFIFKFVLSKLYIFNKK